MFVVGLVVEDISVVVGDIPVVEEGDTSVVVEEDISVL